VRANDHMVIVPQISLVFQSLPNTLFTHRQICLLFGDLFQ
jgi:hypothetical protein